MRATLVFVLFSVAVPARATILRQLDVDALVDRSSTVVIGVVGEQRTVTSDGRVLTESVVTVERTLFGKAAETVRIYNLGGEADGILTEVSGTVRLRTGTRVLLMLRWERDGRLYVAGMCQGAFRVDGDRLHQRIDVSVTDGRHILPPPGTRELSLRDVEAAVARRGQR